MFPRRRFTRFAPIRRIARAGLFTGLGFVAGRSSAKQAQESGQGVEARLAELERLRTSGAITETEYAAKRRELIDQL